MKTLLLPTIGCILALLLATPANSQVYSFRLVHKDIPVSGSFQIDLSPATRGGVLEFVENEPRQVNIKFSHLNFGSQELNSELKLFVRSTDFKVSGGNLNDNFNLTLRPGQTLPIPITLDKDKKINIAFQAQKFRYTDVETDTKTDFELESAEAFQISFDTKTAPKQQEIAVTPPDDNKPKPVEKPNTPGKQAKQPIEEKIAPDIAAFNNAISLSGVPRTDALKAFLKRFKTSAKVSEAKRLVPIERNPTHPNDSTWRYVLKYATLPQLDSTIISSGKIRITEQFSENENGHVLEFVFRGGSTATLFISDPSKESEDHRNDTISVDSEISYPKCILTPAGSSKYALNLTQGVPPFRLEFFYNDERIPKLSEFISNTDTTILLNIETIRNGWNEGNGYGKLTLLLVQRKENLSFDVPGFIEVPKLQSPFLYIGIGLGALLLIFLIVRIRQRAAYQATKAKVEKARKEKGEPEDVYELHEPTVTPDMTATLPTNSGMLKIKQTTPAQQIDKKALSEAEFEALLENGGYHRLDMRQHWLDTVLTDIYASKKSILGIDEFLRHQRTKQIEEQEGTIPEIGGFLMGKYTHSPISKRYRVALEEFVPIVPEENTVYQLQFSTESLVRELGDMQDEYPDLSLIGWFHTHPGHGLFLSKPDMTIHDGFFREPYQFAMEIDTLTENLDTGFFTRTLAGPVNNQEARLPETTWFDWTQIEKATRRK